MGDKSTYELNKILENAKPKDIRSYLADNKEDGIGCVPVQIINQLIQFPERFPTKMLSFKCTRKIEI